MKGVFFNNKKYRNNAILCVAGMLFCIVTTSFNISQFGPQSFERQINDAVIQWYNLHLILEQKDLEAYPPVAARRAAQLGIAGILVYKTHAKDIELENPNALLLLHNVYAALLTNFYCSNPAWVAMIENQKRQLSTGIKTPDERQNIAANSLWVLNKLEELSPKWPTKSSDCAGTEAQINRQISVDTNKSILPGWQHQPVFLHENSRLQVRSPFVNDGRDQRRLVEEALTVYYTSQQLSDEKKWIAEFWSDDIRGLTFSPAGRWLSITNQLTAKQPMPISHLFDMYAKVGIGLNDAITLCWKFKYMHAIERPSVKIKTHFEPSWKPLHEDPSFPSYPSGHATIGYAATSILQPYFGENISFSDKSHIGRVEFLGMPRHYTSLSEMAKENAASRIYLGVHYPLDCFEGMKLGQAVGKNIRNTDLSTLIFDTSALN